MQKEIRPVVLYRAILSVVALGYSAVVSPYPSHAPSVRLVWLIMGYSLFALLPVLWATIRGASDWFRTASGTILLRITCVVDVLFLLALAYGAGEGNDLWATFFIPWAVMLVLCHRHAIPIPILDTILGIVLAVMIVLTVWIAIRSVPISPVANALILWGVFLEGWVMLRFLSEERREWSHRLERDAQELDNLKNMTDAIPTGLVLLKNGTVAAATEPGESLLGFVPGKSLSESRLPKNIVQSLQESRLEDEGPYEAECPAELKDGTKIYVGISAFPVADGKEMQVLVLETRKASALREKRLSRSNRLASVGQLAAGMAHELGNPIAIIKSCASYLVGQYERGDPRLEEIEIIQRESGRCQDLLARLKSLASAKEEARCFDLRSSVQEAVSLVRYQTREIDLSLSMPRESVPIFADPGQLVALLVNLLLNAVQSMAETPKEAGIAVVLETGKEKETVLRITDHGRGMTAEEREKIFDPFYTGRPDGTGLGLSIVNQVIEQIGGRIDLESEPGKGTTFTITVPLSEDSMNMENSR
ncbi:MAG TPA: HAMP domain-containing sensor histidine kinase [bacterium]|nr:HAMP domain-containing sensor histidine kinase [bacterium]